MPENQRNGPILQFFFYMLCMSSNDFKHFLTQLFHYFHISKHFHVPWRPCCSFQRLKFTHSELTQPQGRPDLIDQSGSLPTSFEVENIWWELRQTRVSNPPSLLRKYEMGPWMDVFPTSKLLVYIFRKCLL